MEDRRTLYEIQLQLERLNEIMEQSNDFINSIDLLMVSNNNSTAKDREIAEKIYILKDKISDICEYTTTLQKTL